MADCFRCRGLGRQGFMGVASYPCPRCGGSGVDPNPTEEEARRINNPPAWTSSPSPSQSTKGEQ